MAAAPMDRETVLAAARRCFLTFGFKATTVEHVAEEAGTSRTTVMRLVGGRSKLIDVVLVEEAQALLLDLADGVMASDTLDDFVRSIVRGALLAVEQRPLLRRAAGPDILTLLPDTTTEGLPMIAALADGGRAILAAFQGRFRLDGVDPATFDDLAEDLVRYILALLHTPTIDGRNRDPDAAAERAANLFVPAFRDAARRARGEQT